MQFNSLHNWIRISIQTRNINYLTFKSVIFTISSHGTASVENNVEELFDEFFRWRMVRSPEFSTLIGMKDYNDILETFTEDRFTSDLAFCEGFHIKIKISSFLFQSLYQRLELKLKEWRTRRWMSRLYWIWSFLKQNFKHSLMDFHSKDFISLSGSKLI